MKEEDIAILAEREIEKDQSEIPNVKYTYVEKLLAKFFFVAGYKSAIKEQVDWDEAFVKYANERAISLHNNFVTYLQENYSLIPKEK